MRNSKRKKKEQHVWMKWREREKIDYKLNLKTRERREKKKHEAFE